MSDIINPPLEGDLSGGPCTYVTRAELEFLLQTKADLVDSLLKIDQLLAATEANIGSVRLATEAEVDAAAVASGDAVARAQHLNVRIDANGAVSLGDLGGDARGAYALNIQPKRNVPSWVASGDESVTIGYAAQSLGFRSVAIGLGASAGGSQSLAIRGIAGGDYSTSVGWGCVVSGLESSGVGTRVYTTVDYTAEFGNWTDTGTRNAVVRCHGATGMVGFTIQDRATVYGDGGATAGSEADNTIMRGGYAIRRNGDDIHLDLNIAGTIKTLSLGTAT